MSMAYHNIEESDTTAVTRGMLTKDFFFELVALSNVTSIRIAQYVLPNTPIVRIWSSHYLVN